MRGFLTLSVTLICCTVWIVNPTTCKGMLLGEAFKMAGESLLPFVYGRFGDAVKAGAKASFNVLMNLEKDKEVPSKKQECKSELDNMKEKLNVQTERSKNYKIEDELIKLSQTLNELKLSFIEGDRSSDDVLNMIKDIETNLIDKINPAIYESDSRIKEYKQDVITTTNTNSNNGNLNVDTTSGRDTINKNNPNINANGGSTVNVGNIGDPTIVNNNNNNYGLDQDNPLNDISKKQWKNFLSGDPKRMRQAVESVLQYAKEEL